MGSAEEWVVYAVGGRRVVYVRPDRADGLRAHLASRGFPAALTRTDGPGLDWLELRRHADMGEAQAALDACPRGEAMQGPKSLQARQAELQALMATPGGRAELERLASSYAAAAGSPRPWGTSVITYIIVQERRTGLVSG